MTDTKALLHRISAFRQRLEKMPRLLPDRLEVRGELPAIAAPPPAAPDLPPRLGERARSLLEEARKLIAALCTSTDHSLLQPGAESPQRDPLLAHQRETAALIDGAVRMFRYLPADIAEQWTWCEALEAALAAARHRLAILDHALGKWNREQNLVEAVAGLLEDVAEGRPVASARVDALVEILMGEPAGEAPIGPASAGAEPARRLAGHAVRVCRVLRRTAADVGELPLLLKAGMLADVALLRLPAELLAKAEWDDAGRRSGEAHCNRGAAMIRHSLPDSDPVADLAAAHHERGDGTGYPNGWKGGQLRPAARQLAIADAYATLIGAGTEPRTALTDTLLDAERGLFDPQLAQALLAVGFYPVGSAVELADGSVAGVIAGPRRGAVPTRPVVVLLADAEGRPHPVPVPVDLSEVQGRSVVRTLSPTERRAKLGRSHPDWAI